ncbi:FAD binding domain-containing protein [Plenodomus tracheiphilus IPT5]|uniref:FAD binding domain-containing protein n=1 Tax=Plenodomus tracheiphilus IPT5 TaxID=1408161 RepID=A0A6A7B675_9PLEO|nr:FAD binding domain-containing protein [Plenodomus tracheiphilus IPT5]
MHVSLVSLLLLFATAASAHCKCAPDDECWPSELVWDRLNRQVDGRLIRTKPVAQSCYPGPDENRAACDYVVGKWSNPDFQTTHPLCLAYPVNITCPPVNYTSGATPRSCTLGSNPRYAVNATTTEHIKRTIAFAKHHNIRLVTKSTGHDLNGRSDGFGSLELWLRYHRNGIEFQPKFTSTNGCQRGTWNGSAIKIRGAYQWKDVYMIAKEYSVIVVGGGSPSVGAVGGWATGGGHGPATRHYGMGADQILEVEAVTANGSIVIANACENTDLYKAFRGGGPGFTVMLSFTVKAYANVPVIAVQRLEVVPVGGNISALIDAVAVLFQQFPAMNAAGFAGYGYWAVSSIAPFFGNTSIGYYHDFWTIGKNAIEAKEAFVPMRKELERLERIVTVNETYKQYPEYWSMYDAESGLDDVVGSEAALTSRLFNLPSVSNLGKVREYIKVASGSPQDFVSNVVLLVSGQDVGEDAYSGLHPAWRTSPFLHVIGWGWAPGSTEELKAYVRNNVTSIKGAAQKALAPDTGGYMNEGDRLDPHWKQTFYGARYEEHLVTKRRHDPEGLFYCPTCVGSDEWVDEPERPLCRA